MTNDECIHALEREGCIHCAPRFQGKDVRDGFCPDCNRSGPLVASTWHIVNSDGTSECCACGHAHAYAPGHLASGADPLALEDSTAGGAE